MKHEFTSHQIWTAVAGAVAEWFFAVLPLLVVTIVMTHLGRSTMILESAEWAFGASILAGQALVRLVAGVVRAKKLAIERVILGISTILVLVVVPANITLALVIMAEANDQHISSLLVTAQAGLFFFSSALFILIASFAHLWTRRADHPLIRSSEI